jgi:hypothetical protein
MMEYLAHVHTNPFAGVLSHSAQQEGGTNVALFPEMNEELVSFPVRYVDDSLKICETTTIKYEHKVQKVKMENGKLTRDWEDAELEID